MKTLTYDYEKMIRVGQLLNAMNFQGIGSARIIAEIGDILDSGKLGEIVERPKEGSEKDGMDSQKVRPDKLEK